MSRRPLQAEAVASLGEPSQLAQTLTDIEVQGRGRHEGIRQLVGLQGARIIAGAVATSGLGGPVLLTALAWPVPGLEACPVRLIALEEM